MIHYTLIVYQHEEPFVVALPHTTTIRDLTRGCLAAFGIEGKPEEFGLIDRTAGPAPLPPDATVAACKLLNDATLQLKRNPDDTLELLEEASELLDGDPRALNLLSRIRRRLR